MYITNDQRSSDYWYLHRAELGIGMIFRTRDCGIVMLAGYVPGDGTLMYVADRYDGKWCYQDSKAEPSDLVGEPLTEETLAALGH
jgi:hypothetical protein